jgi:hypothetical protein
MSRFSSTPAFVGIGAVFATFFLASGAPTPLLALRQQEWGFSAGTLTFAFSVYALALLAALLVGMSAGAPSYSPPFTVNSPRCWSSCSPPTSPG